jgi:hypothetical protein
MAHASGSMIAASSRLTSAGILCTIAVAGMRMNCAMPPSATSR